MARAALWDYYVLVSISILWWFVRVFDLTHCN